MPEFHEHVDRKEVSRQEALDAAFLHLARLVTHVECWTLQRMSGDIETDMDIATLRATYIENSREWLRWYASRNESLTRGDYEHRD